MATIPKDRFRQLLAQIRQKYSLSELRAILKEEGLVTAVGWDQLAERFEEGDAALQIKGEKILKQIHGDLILGGTKDVHIFDLQKGEASKIAEVLKDIEPASPSYGAIYPLALSETALRELPYDYELAGKVAYPNGDISLVYCAKRTVEEQVRYGTNEVAAAVRDAFAGFDEFIAIRKMDFQVFDVLTVRPKLDRIEILIDYPDRIRGPETSEGRCLSILGRTVTLVPSLNSTYEHNKPLNLLACINNLYQKKNEGRVSRLLFRSPTDSVKKESMTSSKDLRIETFHAAGVVAVGTITPYDVTVTWDKLIGVQGTVGVRVGTPISSLSSEEPYVRTARIFDARSDAAILAVVNKLVSYST
ncbi:hypothetical protein [Polaromonas sp. JS666]|uniref:hypothetical protein n=1 Tax=Polaromonas sp. (strain JS666 / ATCC BAA-500) TaxID=296591 RepID=UPI0008852535|nr:hypothetical protein [Polaromonas sp. JS666]SDO16204.1 hypothetical protein SAMN05720382_1169 [Polaromonas sp. JS666]